MPTHLRSRSLVGVGAWCALVAAALVWGHRLVESRPAMRITAAPLVGTWEPLYTRRTAVPILFAVVVVAVAGSHRATERLKWRTLVVVTAAVAVGWLLALNHVDAAPGVDPLRAPLATRYDYAAGIADVKATGAAEYLRTFTSRIDDYPTHVRGHPPGMVMILWAADGLGLDPVDAALGLVLIGWALAIGGALVAAREVTGELATRHIAPFLALLPGAIWAGISLDAFFAGVTVVGTALLLLASGARGRRSQALAACGGLLLGVALLLSYGTAPALLIPVAAVALRRRPGTLLIGGAATAAVLLAAAATGFWWLDGLHTTRAQYAKGLASVRPYSYWVLGNLAALALATGPVVGGAIACVGRTWRQAILGLSAAVAVLVADLSGLSKGEVERIWLPFVPWLASLAALLPVRRASALRGWLVAQATVAITVQVWLRSPW